MINITNVSHSYTIGKKQGKQVIPVLHNVSLTVNKGEIVSIIGKSGSGKSTLLHIASGFLTPDSGQVLLNQQDIVPLSEEKRADVRLSTLGFIFQNFQLMPKLTAKENILLPLKLSGVEKTLREKKVEEWMYRLEIGHVQDHYPSELSGGQQQRVAIARAMVHEPPLILADEPTGNVDTETEASILSIIQSINREFNTTFVMITHDNEVAAISHRTLLLKEGRIQEVSKHEVG
ncbi:ABC transporter ATP-binding protein [Priestia megaterium]|nr:ABC transporter ATP-binding protein [Priestia megaterium]